MKCPVSPVVFQVTRNVCSSSSLLHSIYHLLFLHLKSLLMLGTAVSKLCSGISKFAISATRNRIYYTSTTASPRCSDRCLLVQINVRLHCKFIMCVVHLHGSHKTPVVIGQGWVGQHTAGQVGGEAVCLDKKLCQAVCLHTGAHIPRQPHNTLPMFTHILPYTLDTVGGQPGHSVSSTASNADTILLAVPTSLLAIISYVKQPDYC